MIAGDGAQREDRRRARTCTSRSCGRSPKLRRRRARLDRAARQPRPLPVPRLIDGGVAAGRAGRPRRTTRRSRDPTPRPTRRRTTPEPGTVVGRMPGSSTPRTPTASACPLRLDVLPERRGRVVLDVPRRCPIVAGPVVVRDHEVPLPRARPRESAPKACGPSCGARRRSSTGRTGSRRSACALDDAGDALTRRDRRAHPDRPRHRVGDRRADPQRTGRLADRRLRAPGIVHGDVLLGRRTVRARRARRVPPQLGRPRWQHPGAWSLVCHGPDLGLHLRDWPTVTADGFVRPVTNRREITRRAP